MAKAKIFKIQGEGKTYFIPANGVKTLSEAAKSVGFAPEQYFGITVYSKEGETAEEFVARKGGTITEAKIDIDYSRASIAGELLPPTGEERFGAYEPPPVPTDVEEDKDLKSYNNYLEYIKTHPSWPAPKDISDWYVNRDYWESIGDYLDAGYSIDQIEGYTEFQAYQSKYGNLQDWLPENLGDYLQNTDKAREQLDLWRQEAGPEATGFTDAQIQEYKDYQRWYYQYGKPGDLMPVDPGDFINRHDEYQQQLGVWQQQAAEAEQYEIDPAEAARRREEAYEESRYAAEERYRATPEYSPVFTPWLEGQGQLSGALESFTEKRYPSLVSGFKATQPTLTGFPTREGARAEKARREQAFQAWLPAQMPRLEEKYWAQRPAERGERLWMQAPGLRGINW